MASFSFTLHPVPPFRLDLTAWALKRRAQNKMDELEKGVYRRVLPFGEHPVEIVVSLKDTTSPPCLNVRATGKRIDAKAQPQIALTIEKIFALHADLSDFYKIAHQDPHLSVLANRFRGLKPPRFPTAFEAVANGIACQQLSLTVGIIVLNRLCEACALSMKTDAGIRYAFPRPQDVMKLATADLKGLGFSTRKAQYLLEIAGMVAAGELDLEHLEEMPREQALELLTGLRGIGRWTAEYVLLRGVGDLSVFPGDDVGGRKKLQRWLGIGSPLAYDDVRNATAKWNPYAGLIYFHLLLDGLSKEGYIRENTP